jgi:hypothetical protein
MAIDELSLLIHLPTDNVPGSPPPEDTPDKESIDLQLPDLTCTPDPRNMRAHQQVLGDGKEYGKTTGLSNKHHKYSEQWNACHPFQSAHDFQQAQTFGQHTKVWIDRHLRCGLDNFNIERFQSAEAPQKLLSRLDLGLCNDSGIGDHLHILGILYYRDSFK